MTTSPRSRRRTPMLVLAAGLLVVPMACGDDDDGTPATVTETDADGPVDTDDPVDNDDPDDTDVATAEIVISGFAFSGPGTVSVGTTVIVQNTDDAQHTWTSVDGVFDSGAMAGGETFSFTFDEPGEFAYVCEFHPSMTGTLVVTE